MKKLFAALMTGLILLSSVSAQDKKSESDENAITIEEFCKLNIKGPVSVKIKDRLSRTTSGNLMSKCYAEKKDIGPIDLDLSECDFSSDENNIVFTNLGNVRSIILPKSTKTVTFCCGSKIESVVLPDGLERIEEQAFCFTKLADVKIPSSVKYVGACAFGNIDNILYIDVTENKNVKSWSELWNACNAAKVLYTKKDKEDFDNRSHTSQTSLSSGSAKFSKETNHFAFDEISLEIKLTSPVKNAGKAKINFYDVNSNRDFVGSIDVQLKKNQKDIKLKAMDLSEFDIGYTDLSSRIKSVCGDYYAKIIVELELEDGTRISLDGFCRIYVESYPGSIS